MKNKYYVAFSMEDGRVLWMAGDGSMLYATCEYRHAYDYTNKRRAADDAKRTAKYRLCGVKSIDVLTPDEADDFAWSYLVARAMEIMIDENSPEDVEEFAADLLGYYSEAMDYLWSLMDANDCHLLDELDYLYERI